MTDDEDDFMENVPPCEGILHDPLDEDLSRLVDLWGLATVIHGVKCMAMRAAEAEDDSAERARLETIAQQLDGAWCEAEGGER